MDNSKYKQSAPGIYYHLYNRGNQKRKIFLDEEDYRLYLRKLVEARKRYRFAIISYCLMPNHAHLIVRQDGVAPTSRFMASLHTGYAMRFKKKYDSVGHLFQGRFKQKVISDDGYMKNLIAYVHLNPVQAGICDFPKEYRWSSYLEYAGAAIIKDSEKICDHGLVEEYGFKGRSFDEFIEAAGQIAEEDAFDD